MGKLMVVILSLLTSYQLGVAAYAKTVPELTHILETSKILEPTQKFKIIVRGAEATVSTFCPVKKNSVSDVQKSAVAVGKELLDVDTKLLQVFVVFYERESDGFYRNYLVTRKNAAAYDSGSITEAQMCARLKMSYGNNSAWNHLEHSYGKDEHLIHSASLKLQEQNYANVLKEKRSQSPKWSTLHHSYNR